MMGATCLTRRRRSWGRRFSWKADGDELTGAADAGGGLPHVTFQTSRVGPLPPQDPARLDGDWLVEAKGATSDCTTVEPSADAASQ